MIFAYVCLSVSYIHLIFEIIRSWTFVVLFLVVNIKQLHALHFGGIRAKENKWREI